MATGSDQNDILNAIMEASLDAIVVADAKGQILSANPAAGALFGHLVADLIGQNVKILMPADMARQHDGFMEHHLKTGERKIIGTGREVEGMHKDGSTFPLHLTIGRADKDTHDGPIFTAMLHDLTEKHASQRALERSQRLDAIGQMTGGIAHDFNNLLTVIIGNLELLELKLADEQNIGLLKDALESAELGADLTHRLMIFARRSNLKPLHVDLRKVCSEALAILRRVLGSTYEIRTDFPPKVALVTIDPAQLQSALMNLALNARDAMGDDGELLISIENVTVDDTYMAQETDILPGDYVRLSVSDDGAGMSQEAQQRAFEPFFTTKTDRGGTGLGLAMVYGFVRQSGGHITLYSEEGHGTSFGLYFPASAATSANGLPEDSTGAPTMAGIFEGKSVLVVEDNPKVRSLSVARLKDLGFDVIEAKSGDAAYEALASGKKVDLIFSDLVMPGDLNGYALAAKARNEFPNTKVLLTSGYASDVVTGRMGQGQYYDILHKPYRIAELAARIQALFSDTA
ncbi:MAG: PAS domain S-box protein [Silicimonas sp.]|nr:PAS domain S-box protein [Silicimonas sp.]